MDSVTRLIRISVQRNIVMRVGFLVMEMARVMNQYATMLRHPATGRKTAALAVIDVGLVRTRLVRNIVDTRERSTLEHPATSINKCVEIPRLLHFAAETLPRDAAKAV